MSPFLDHIILRHMNINENFIKQIYFFHDRKKTEYDCVIKLNHIAVFLDTETEYLVTRLTKIFEEGKAYEVRKVTSKKTNQSYNKYYVSYITLKLLILCLTRTKESEKMMEYFNQIEETLIRYRYEILEEMYTKLGIIHDKNYSETAYYKMMFKKMKVVDFLKEVTFIDHKFIDEFYSFRDCFDGVCSPLDFVVDLNKISKWLETDKYMFEKKLINNYKEELDYVILYDGKHCIFRPEKFTTINYIVNVNTFKKLCMTSETKNGFRTRQYFVEIESTLIRYQHVVIRKLKREVEIKENNAKIKKMFKGRSVVYVLKIDLDDDIYKIGITADIIKRIAGYNTGNLHEYEIVAVIETRKIRETERCIIEKLKDKQYMTRSPEVFEAELKDIMAVIGECKLMKDQITYQNTDALLGAEGGGNENIVVNANKRFIILIDKSEFSTIRQHNFINSSIFSNKNSEKKKRNRSRSKSKSKERE